MPKRTIDHRSWLLKRLTDPAIARNYLNAAISDSPDMFLKALRNVAEAHKMATVASKAGVAREALYKTLSEEGNPRLNTLGAVLEAVGLRMAVEATGSSSPLRGPSQQFGGQSQRASIIKRQRSRRGVPAHGLISFSFQPATQSEEHILLSMGRHAANSFMFFRHGYMEVKNICYGETINPVQDCFSSIEKTEDVTPQGGEYSSDEPHEASFLM